MYRGYGYGGGCGSTRRADQMRHTTHLSPDEPFSSAIVSALATVLDVDPLRVPVLQEAVDVDALRSLVASERSTSEATLTVRFVVADCEVVVSDDGSVCVTDERERRGPGRASQPAPASAAALDTGSEREGGNR